MTYLAWKLLLTIFISIKFTGACDDDDEFKLVPCNQITYIDKFDGEIKGIRSSSITTENCEKAAKKANLEYDNRRENVFPYYIQAKDDSLNGMVYAIKLHTTTQKKPVYLVQNDDKNSKIRFYVYVKV